MKGSSHKSLGILAAIAVIGVLLIAGCSRGNTAPQATGPGIHNIPPQEAFNLIQANKASADFVIIDDRPSWQFELGHIEGATNIYLNIKDTAPFREKINALDKNKTYLTYCPDGCGAAARIMSESGFKTIYDISGGYNRWLKEDLPVVK